MKQQENMILNQLNQYRNLYLQACNENTRLKHAMSKHEDELKANQSVIESLEDRIREQGEELIEEKQNIKQISEELDSCKKKLGEEREDHLKTKAELKQAKEDIAKLQVAKEAKELSEQANVDLLSVVQVLQRRLFQTNSDASSYMKGQVDFDERRMSEMSFDDVVSEANKLVKELIMGMLMELLLIQGRTRSCLIPIRKRRLKKTISQSVNATSFQSRFLTIWVLIHPTCRKASS